jgi:hypothetical protein
VGEVIAEMLLLVRNFGSEKRRGEVSKIWNTNLP